MKAPADDPSGLAGHQLVDLSRRLMFAIRRDVRRRVNPVKQRRKAVVKTIQNSVLHPPGKKKSKISSILISQYFPIRVNSAYLERHTREMKFSLFHKYARKCSIPFGAYVQI